MSVHPKHRDFVLHLNHDNRVGLGVALFLGAVRPSFGEVNFRVVLRRPEGRLAGLFFVGRFPETAFFVRLRPIESVARVRFVRFWAFRLAIGLSFRTLTVWR